MKKWFILMGAWLAVVGLLFCFDPRIKAYMAWEGRARLGFKALELTPAYQERFLAKDGQGFAEILEVIKDNRKLKYADAELRGVTNSRGLCFLAYENNTYSMIAPTKEVLLWFDKAKKRRMLRG